MPVLSQGLCFYAKAGCAVDVRRDIHKRSGFNDRGGQSERLWCTLNDRRDELGADLSYFGISDNKWIWRALAHRGAVDDTTFPRLGVNCCQWLRSTCNDRGVNGSASAL